MRKMKLWFISVNRVSDKDFVRYGLQELATKGVDIEVIDLSDLMWGTSEEKLTNTLLFEQTYCSKLPEFLSVVDRISTVDVVLCGGTLSPKLHYTLSKKCRYIGLQVLGAMPQLSTPTSHNIIKKILVAAKGKRFLRRVFLKIYSYRIFKNSPYFFVQRAGYLSSSLYPGINSQTKILECQCYDVYQYLYEAQFGSSKSKKGEYLLWIDQAIPFHTDTLKFNGDISHHAESYFSRIQSLLRKYGEMYGLKIIVSLHPRMLNDSRYLESWKGWTVIKKDTIDYIKYSKLCLTHNSTAIHAAAFFGTPLAVVKDKLLSDHGYDIGLSDSFYRELNCNLIESDCIDQPELNFEVNHERYDEYIRKYVSNTAIQTPINAEAIYSFMCSIEAEG